MKALILLIMFATPIHATNMELVAFEEICEITGEVKKGIRYEPVSLSVVEPINLNDNISK